MTHTHQHEMWCDIYNYAASPSKTQSNHYISLTRILLHYNLHCITKKHSTKPLSVTKDKLDVQLQLSHQKPLTEPSEIRYSSIEQTQNIHIHTYQNILHQTWSHPKTKWKSPRTLNRLLKIILFTLSHIKHREGTIGTQLNWHTTHQTKIISTTTLSYLYNQLAAQTSPKLRATEKIVWNSNLPTNRKHHKSTKNISNPDY